MDGNRLVPPSTIQLLVVAHHPLDGEMLSAQFRARAEFVVERTECNVQAAAAICRERHPDVVLFDASFVGRNAGFSLAVLEGEFGSVPMLLLDDETNFGRLSAVLESSSMGYFTRAASFAELADGVRQLARGVRVFCSKVQERLIHVSSGWRFRSDKPNSPFDRLTRRELEVARMIASGSSVPQCARVLHLSPSTVDNHKSRFMKKLGLHKSHDLTRMAIREGLIHD